MDILIADDDEPSRVYLELVCKALSHSPTIVADGSDVLTILESFSFDAILLDIEMPKMGGLETVRRIRDNPAVSDTPVFAITAHVNHDWVLAIRESGFSGYLAKPCSPEQLALVLSQGTNSAGRWVS